MREKFNGEQRKEEEVAALPEWARTLRSLLKQQKGHDRNP